MYIDLTFLIISLLFAIENESSVLKALFAFIIKFEVFKQSTKKQSWTVNKGLPNNIFLLNKHPKNELNLA